MTNASSLVTSLIGIQIAILEMACHFFVPQKTQYLTLTASSWRLVFLPDLTQILLRTNIKKVTSL